MTCPDCDGTGMVETGRRPGCECPYHDHVSAECFCACKHSGDECGFCQGTGAIVTRPARA